VQEAKRQVSHLVGIDGFAGPSDLTVIATQGADVEALKLDLAAQAEHGEGSLTVAISDDPEILERLEASSRVLAHDMEAALALAEALAPEHLQLAGETAEALAPRIRNAGCLFVGNAAGTAFGDYVAGSNHTLPTDGAARFASGLTVAHFRRRMSEVRARDERKTTKDRDRSTQSSVHVLDPSGLVRTAVQSTVEGHFKPWILPGWLLTASGASAASAGDEPGRDADR